MENYNSIIWGESGEVGKYFYTEYTNQALIVKTPITGKVKTITLLGMDFMLVKIKEKWTVTDFKTGADLTHGHLSEFKNTQKAVIELAEKNLKKIGLNGFKELQEKTITNYLKHNKRVQEYQ